VISAIVLAAGEAKRFGEAKQLVKVRGKALLEHVLNQLRSPKIGEVIVVLGARADEIQKQVKFGSERVVVNADHALGMSTSIQAGLRAVSGNAALVVLADQPFVRPETIDQLIDVYERRRPKIVIPTFAGKRGNPVVIDRSLFDAMMKIRGDVGFRAIFGDYAGEIVSVPVSDRGVVTDIDTADDLEGI